MKICLSFFIIIFLFICSCSQTVHINSEKTTKEPIEEVEKIEKIEVIPDTSRDLRIMFSIQGDFQSGIIRPDIVNINGKIIYENNIVSQGTHLFEVEKKGYKKKSEKVLVNDPENDGIFNLRIKLEAKERLVIFDIREEGSDKIIKPDRVVLMALDDEKQEVIDDKSYVKPGIKKLVIQKEGYEPISASITIKPDEEPYILQYKISLKK